MTATRVEVLRCLPPELGGTASDGHFVRGKLEHRRWELELLEAPRLRIGPLDLEVTELVIRLWGYTEQERAHFVARLEQYTRRGGG